MKKHIGSEFFYLLDIGSRRKQRTAHFFVLNDFFFKVGNRNLEVVGSTGNAHEFYAPSVNELFVKTDLVRRKLFTAFEAIRHLSSFLYRGRMNEVQRQYGVIRGVFPHIRR